jgi:hypothetical protein
MSSRTVVRCSNDMDTTTTDTTDSEAIGTLVADPKVIEQLSIPTKKPSTSPFLPELASADPMKPTGNGDSSTLHKVNDKDLTKPSDTKSKEMDSNGIIVVKPSGKTIKMDSDGIIVVKPSGKTIKMDSNGIIVVKPSGKTIKMDSNGIMVVKPSGKTIKMDPYGIRLNKSSGSKVVHVDYEKDINVSTNKHYNFRYASRGTGVCCFPPCCCCCIIILLLIIILGGD